MKPDIANRSDIEKIVALFYDNVRSDAHIAFFFSDVVSVNWDTHLNKMCSFWENVLFYTGDYQGDPLVTHKNLSHKYETQAEHFETWLVLFFAAVDSLFEGDNAEKIKSHAAGIAAVMQQRMKLYTSTTHN